MSSDEKKIEKMRETYLHGINAKAREYARNEGSVQILQHHMMAAILDSMANAYVYNTKVSEKLNSLTAGIEALRRAIAPRSVPETPEA